MDTVGSMVPNEPRLASVLREEFEFEDTPVPFIGWYFAFRINPEQTLPLLRVDEVAALKSQSKIYVAYMARLSGLYDPDKAIHTASAVLLSSGPSSNDKRFRTTDMSVAVAPNSHVVRDRQPLQSEPPLPWARAYHATVDSGLPVIRIQSRRLGCLKVHELPSTQRNRLRRYCTEDRETRHASACAATQIAVPPLEILREEEPKTSAFTCEDRAASAARSPLFLNTAHKQAVKDVQRVPSPRDHTAGGDPLTFENVTGAPEASDIDEALMIVQAANAHHDKKNPYAPVLDIITYDLATIVDFGSPEEYHREVAQLEQLIPQHEARMHKQHEREKREFVRAKRHSLPPDQFPWLADLPVRAMSVPPDLDRVVPLEPGEWHAMLARSEKEEKENTSKALELRHQAESLLGQARDLRQQADVLAREADVCEDDAVACDQEDAEARKDAENAKTFARFLGIDLNVHGGTSMVLDRFFTSLPPSDEPFSEEVEEPTSAASGEGRIVEDGATQYLTKAPVATSAFTSAYSGGSWLARLGEFGLVLTAGILIGRAWKK